MTSYIISRCNALKNCKHFITGEEANSFLCSSNYLRWASTINRETKTLASRINWGSPRINRQYMNECYNVLDELMNTCPPVNQSFIAFRRGKIEEKERPYISASLLKSVADRFKGPLNIILIPQNSIVYPSYISSGARVSNDEYEIIIDNRCYSHHFWYIEYKRIKC